jgi:uncharacterized protein
VTDSLDFRNAIGFEWDEGNADKNWIAHDVTQAECEQIFFNLPCVIGQQAGNSSVEARHYVLGQTDRGRLLFLVVTIRRQRIRVITARDMTAKERKAYARR